ncbi:hypothetical protein PAXRUDRAFT_179070 [Paxillus rubicundulus Ve08.2h10]|uniref:Uncharacterized protein n=1 Tax=Paxillus rubicundulus Ve08.2h10 TaxID=930991 RepID=A0A0D0D047_9AGAM|nr:hypothetical protein PAXRUDRAFT_179070 [Paxillus rubicundulus Ve08.2h10]
MASSQDVSSPSTSKEVPPSSSHGNDPCHCTQAEDLEDTDNSEYSPQAHLLSSPSQSKHTFEWHSIDTRTALQLDSARVALADLKKLLHPHCPSGHGYKATNLTSLLKKRLTWMEYFLRAFVKGTQWSAASLQTAQFIGKGTYMSCKVREWSKAYILDHENLPWSKHGEAWTKSQINDEELKDKLLTHLQSHGKYVTASAIVNYLERPEVQRRYKLSRTITLQTAERWMKACGFRWTVS